LIVTLTQIGYGAGLLFIVPLTDLVEIAASCSSCSRFACSLSWVRHCRLALALPYRGTVCGLRLGVVQMLVPYAAHMASDAERGPGRRNVMSGTLLGIMLARPISSFVAHIYSWHAVFFLSAGATTVLALVLSRALPKRAPTAKLHYGRLLTSMVNLVATTPVLQRRALYQALLGGAFSLFWTTTRSCSQGGVPSVARRDRAIRAGWRAGAIAAPIGGRLADRGWSRTATALAMLTVAGAFSDDSDRPARLDVGARHTGRGGGFCSISARRPT